MQAPQLDFPRPLPPRAGPRRQLLSHEAACEASSEPGPPARSVSQGELGSDTSPVPSLRACCPWPCPIPTSQSPLGLADQPKVLPALGPQRTAPVDGGTDGGLTRGVGVRGQRVERSCPGLWLWNYHPLPPSGAGETSPPQPGAAGRVDRQAVMAA